MTLKIRLAISVIALQLFLASSASLVKAAESVKVLAHRAQNLLTTVGADKLNQPSAELFSISVIFETILREYPKSIEARLLERGRVGAFRVDHKEIATIASAWAEANSEEAKRLQRLQGAAGTRQAATAPDPEPLTEDKPPSDPHTDDDTQLPVADPVDISNFATLLKPPTNGSQGFGAPVKTTRSGVFQNLRRSTVLLYMIGKSKSGNLIPQHVGTGFFVSPTLILTNAHVEEADDKYETYWLAINETMGAKVVSEVKNARKHTPIKIDAALMEVQNHRSEAFIPLNRTFERDEWIAIAGYPGTAAIDDGRYGTLETALRNAQAPSSGEIPSALVDEGRLNNSIINRETSATDLQYTMVTAGGNSGSPVVNACGEAVGLHYAGRSDQNSNAKYNLSVSIKDVVLFLQQINADVEVKNSRCQVAF